MNALVQNSLALLIAFAATGYIGLRVYRLFTRPKTTGCGHCAGGCSKTQSPTATSGLVSLDLSPPTGANRRD